MPQPYKKHVGSIESILTSPWEHATFLCLVLLMIGFIILPFFLGNTIASHYMLPIFQTIFGYTALFFGMVGLIQFANETFLSDSDIDSVENIPQPNQHIKKTRTQSVPNAFSYHQSHSAVTIENVSRQWSTDFLQTLDWKVFESLCSAYFTCIGIPNQETSIGADGGVDIVLYGKDKTNPTAVVQCKQWANIVGVKPLRELLGVMTHQKINKGFFITSGHYSKAALTFGKENHLGLVEGQAMIKRIKSLSPSLQLTLYQAATKGDYTTPSCARCGTKMIKRQGKTKAFWGCQQFPKCRHTLTMKSR